MRQVDFLGNAGHKHGDAQKNHQYYDDLVSRHIGLRPWLKATPAV
jgi:hypothetical protein